MNVSRFARVIGLAVAVAATAPVTANAAMLHRIYDPSTHSFVTIQPERPDPNRPLDQKYEAQVVTYETAEAPGTIIVDSGNKFLYFVLKDGMAIRYGVGVGREGFGWSGTVRVGAKSKEWPSWTPPAEMIERRPELVKYADGMPGGPDNPLGARALYLFDGGRDTMFRIHGTNEPWSIGQNVSSGCIRMLNAHVIELARMVEVGTKVIVM
jgi:lipoprotein-anchoring transpeptidase ErfK/SrfK